MCNGPLFVSLQPLICRRRLTEMMLSWFSCENITRNTSRLAWNAYFWAFYPTLGCCMLLNSKNMRKIIIWGQLRLKFSYGKIQSYMISRKYLFFCSSIFLLHFENFEILFQWNIIPFLIIFLTKSNESMVFVIIQIEV